MESFNHINMKTAKYIEDLIRFNMEHESMINNLIEKSNKMDNVIAPISTIDYLRDIANLSEKEKEELDISLNRESIKYSKFKRIIRQLR